MISEGSCGSEDWSNDAEKFSFASQDKINFKIYQLDNFQCKFNVKCRLSEHKRGFFQYIKKI